MDDDGSVGLALDLPFDVIKRPDGSRRGAGGGCVAIENGSLVVVAVEAEGPWMRVSGSKSSTMVTVASCSSSENSSSCSLGFELEPTPVHSSSSSSPSIWPYVSFQLCLGKLGHMRVVCMHVREKAHRVPCRRRQLRLLLRSLQLVQLACDVAGGERADQFFEFTVHMDE